MREELHELPAEGLACLCCGEARPEIGEERTAEYDLVPAHVVKIVHVWKKYGPCSCGGFHSSSAGEVIAASGPAKKSYMWVAVGYRDGKPIHRFAYHPSRAGASRTSGAS